MRTFVVVMLTACAISFTSFSAKAQFKNGKDLIGPQIGLSDVGNTVTFGGMFEAPVTHPNDAGPGIIGVSGELYYYHYSYYIDDAVTWIYFGVFGNYHFLLDDRKIDPFAGIGLYYADVSLSGGGLYNYGSGIRLGVQAGVRYFFSPNLAGRLMLGNDASFLTIGVDFGI